jgi:hypothetical protein
VGVISIAPNFFIKWQGMLPNFPKAHNLIGIIISIDREWVDATRHESRGDGRVEWSHHHENHHLGRVDLM